ncbi:CU044_2847 family protein [Nonomuraea sp. MCN248]|uniref:CU044_2847 family protein n=1 Tax=Nonomuraea corallina TaxID=2989783 RepID=A0ABT4S8D7_9ACTN|nr:CU044_2847 family protein [Nonomuraea corallina]MDA0633318.1 CU044_2847 family protein [Nonomuraea corallina]
MALRDGSVVHVEMSMGEELVASRLFNFGDVVGKISAITEEVGDAIRAAAPDVATVELGFEIGVESGGLTAILAKGTGKANLKVTFEWRRAEHPTAAGTPEIALPAATPDPNGGRSQLDHDG